MQFTTVSARWGEVAPVVLRQDERQPRMVARPRRGLAPRMVLFSCAVAILAGAAGELARRGAAHEANAAAAGAAAEPPPAVWVDIHRPIPLFALSGSDFGRLPLVYRARRRDAFAERQDLLVFGHFDEDGPMLTLSVFRKGAGPAGPADFFVAMARLAGEAGLSVTRNGLPSLLPSRFGPFVTADVTVSDGAGPRPCLGFRLEEAAPALPVDIAGLACRPSGTPLDRASLTCVLDRIDLVSAGEDEALRAFFVEAERRRGTVCAALAGHGRTSWLDGDATPPDLRHLPGSRIR